MKKVTSSLTVENENLENWNEDLRRQVATLRKQMPGGMETATIKFLECDEGHGRLVGTNWVDSGCLVCALAKNSDVLRRVVHVAESAIARIAREVAGQATYQGSRDRLGAALSSREVDEEDRAWVCDRCGHSESGVWSYCGNCGADRLEEISMDEACG